MPFEHAARSGHPLSGPPPADHPRPAALARARRPRRGAALAALALASGLLSGCAGWRVDDAARVATGFASHLLCDDVFVSGRDPTLAFDERLRPLPGMSPIAWAMARRVDTDRREVTVTLAGGFASRARHRDGLGCVALPLAQWEAGDGDEPFPEGRGSRPDTVAVAPAPLPATLPTPLPAAPDPRLDAVLERALAPRPDRPVAPTKAVVVLRDGRLAAERYAPGYTADTPMLGFSATKSVLNALVGVLVRQGRLAPDQPVPLAEWRAAGDPRGAITIEQLLRQTSGLDLPQDNSGFDPTTRIMYTVRDKAGAAMAAPLAAPPGTRWAYTDTNYVLLSRILRDAVGGHADAVRRFARTELFDPLGMGEVVMDFDATGTPIGASHLSASARDWARFGQLYLDDGRVGDRRILPAGWVARSTTPTLDTGYGAGFWTNRRPGPVPGWGVPWGLSRAPRDAFFARGFMGQFVVVVPSRRLVVARLSISHERGDDIAATDALVGEVLEALGDARGDALADAPGDGPR